MQKDGKDIEGRRFLRGKDRRLVSVRKIEGKYGESTWR